MDKSQIVELILEGRTEEALEILSENYKIKAPKIKIGVPKGKHFALALYDPNKNIIFFKKGEYLYNPFIVLHEFYHAIRFFIKDHRGNEKKANEFALDFIKEYYKKISTNKKRL